MVARIVGTGSAVPENIVTNDDLSRVVDTNDEWISTRTGIRERRIAKRKIQQYWHAVPRKGTGECQHGC